MLNHPRRRVLVVALSMLAMSLGVVFIPTLFAQRVAPAQQDAPLRTLTLDGKGGTPRIANPQARSQPRPLTRAQRLTLFKGKTPIESFKVNPQHPHIDNKASLSFIKPVSVFPSAGGGPPHANFPSGSESSYLGLFLKKMKVGQLYALDFSVYSHSEGTCTITNHYTDVTQTTPVGPVGGSSHITAYVVAEGAYEHENLYYLLRCSSEWMFFEVEVTAL